MKNGTIVRCEAEERKEERDEEPAEEGKERNSRDASRLFRQPANTIRSAYISLSLSLSLSLFSLPFSFALALSKISISVRLRMFEKRSDRRDLTMPLNSSKLQRISYIHRVYQHAYRIGMQQSIRDAARRGREWRKNGGRMRRLRHWDE
jgi:hypothetical protein